MKYDAFVTRDGDAFLIDFPDCLGLQTFAASPDDVAATAKEALEGWLEAHLAERRVPPRPAHREQPAKGPKLISVIVNPKLSASLSVRWSRVDLDISQKELANRVGVTQQAIAKIEDPDGNPTFDTIQKVAAALGLEVHLTFETPLAFKAVRAGRASPK